MALANQFINPPPLFDYEGLHPVYTEGSTLDIKWISSWRNNISITLYQYFGSINFTGQHGVFITRKYLKILFKRPLTDIDGPSFGRIYPQ